MHGHRHSWDIFYLLEAALRVNVGNLIIEHYEHVWNCNNVTHYFYNYYTLIKKEKS
jgi:hypothetical protein